MKKKSGIEVDFTNTETRELIPEGDYIVSVVKVEEREGTKAPYLNWELVIAKGPLKGRKLWNVTSLAPQSLWVLRAVLDALGFETKSEKFKLDLEELVDLQMGVKVTHETFENKERAKVTDTFPVDEAEDISEEDEEDDEESEDEDDEEEDDEEDDEEEEEEDETPPVKKKHKKK